MYKQTILDVNKYARRKERKQGVSQLKQEHSHHAIKAFSQKENLETHELIHTGEKPQPCSKCDKAFSLKANLRANNTTGEKRDVCSRCNKAVSQKVHLQKQTDSHG